MAGLGPRILGAAAQAAKTPCWVYDAAMITNQIAKLSMFDVVRYAQKANSTTAVLRLMRKHGVVVDAVSAGEIHRALHAGYAAGYAEKATPDIVYTADVFDDDALAMVRQHNIAVNVGSRDMIRQLGEAQLHVPIVIRVNPGFGHGHHAKVNTGGTTSKHGIWLDQVPECVALAQQYNLHVHGLHMHIGSGSNFDNLSKVCDAMVTAAAAIPADDLFVISAGGGLPVPYRAEDAAIDVQRYFSVWDSARKRIEQRVGHPVKLEVEPGRFLVAAAGALVASVRAVKHQGDQRYVLVDAGFSELVRPSMYGSYHEISLLSPASVADNRVPCPRDVGSPIVVAGPLCESGDVFTQGEGGHLLPRDVPGAADAAIGDLCVIHTAGAYGASMSSGYNSRLLAAEVMVLRDADADASAAAFHVDGCSGHIVRRRQVLADLVALESYPASLL